MKLYIVVYVAVRSLSTEGTIDELDTLCVVALGPVVISATVAEDEVVWAGRQTERANAESMAPHSRTMRMAQHPLVALM